MKQKILFVLIAISFLSINSCQDDISGPEPSPGRRDYSWSVDTLNYPYATLFRLWGSSPSDLWATSPGDHNLSISHFDGQSWSSYGVPGLISPVALWGDSYNNVFVGAESGRIWKFNGSNWSQFASITKDGHSDVVFNNIWGKSKYDFYAVGGYHDTIQGAYNNSVIAHYYNTKWEILNTSSVIGIVAHLYEDLTKGIVYFQALKMGGGKFPDSTIIYEYSNEKINKIYGSIWTQTEQAFLSHINNEVYFILGKRIARRINGQFQTFLQIDNPNFYQLMWGRSSKDIFLFMLDGLVHYNGSNFEYLLHFDKPRTHIVGAALFEKDIFFLVYESSTNLNIIYHGKIN